MERTRNFVERIKLGIAVGLFALALSACADIPIAPISNTQNPNLPPGCEMVPMGADGLLTYDDLRRINLDMPWTAYLVDPEGQVKVDDRLVDMVVFTHNPMTNPESLPLDDATPLLVAAVRCASEGSVSNARLEFQFYSPLETGFTDEGFYKTIPVIPQSGNNA